MPTEITTHPQKIRVLILEDSPNDAELIIRELSREQFDVNWQRVETESAFLAALDPAPDLILADYSLPQFDGIRAVKLLRERGLNIPFILISGALPEQAAISAIIEHRADDFLAKDRLARLGSAVSNALDRKRLRDEHLQSVATLRESEAELLRFKNVLDNTLDMIFMFEPESLRFVYLNQGSVLSMGYSREELLGMTPYQIEPLIPEPKFRQLIAPLLSGEQSSLRFETVHRRKDGTEFPVYIVLQLVKESDGGSLFVAIVRDTTVRKRAEAELVSAVAVADQANAAKSAFLANMSHEIRTPMNGIIGMTELALDTELNAEQREYIGLVKVSADALLQIINDILDFSKIEAGRLEIENIEFSLEQMLRDTMKSLVLRAHQKDLELLLHVAPDVPDRLISDPGRLRQVLVNLVNNAIKFTQTGEIEVTVHRLKAITPTQSELRFSVRDTGIGIAREKFKTIFDSFSQADTSTTRQYGGTGLGLTISAQLVSLMGGHLGLESELGLGSTFYFTLPLTTGSNDPYARYQSTGRLNGLPVLIVDDNASNRSLLVEMLRNWKMHPTAVESGEQALQELERASATPYALAILDVQMPVMDGFELAQRILAQPKYGGATVMMLTSKDQRGQATRCRELGVASTLMKPIAQSELLDAIMTTLGEPLQASTPRITRHSLPDNRRRLNLLLAEDNAVNQTMAVRLLQKLGHSVTVANNGLEAVEHWQAGRFDAILMDVDMPMMNGYEATERIRAIETTSHGLVPAHTPIVAMTAHVMRGVREICISHGMDAYLAKPIDTEALWRALDGLIPVSVAEPEPEVAPATPVPPCAKVADFAAARQTMDDDRELFEEIARLFQSDAPGQMQKIREALARGESEVVRRGAHTIKGMAGIFNAERTVQAAARLEQLAALGSLKPGALEAAAELEAAMADLQAALLLYQW